MKASYLAIWALVLALLFLSAPAEAQWEADRLAWVQVDLWPDFDRPAVLVLVTARVPADATLPATISLRLPVAAGEPSAVARIDAAGEMLNTPYDAQPVDGATELLVETTEPIIRVEYYYPYDRAGDEVRFTYTWLGGVAVDELTVLLGEPTQATGVTAGAEFQDAGVLADGRRYYEWQIGSVAEDETYSTPVAYTAPPLAPAATALPGAAPPISNPLLILLAALGGLGVGGGVGWFLARRRPPVKPSSGRRRAAKQAFCSQCGDRHQAGDRFCRQCGARVG